MWMLFCGITKHVCELSVTSHDIKMELYNNSLTKLHLLILWYHADQIWYESDVLSWKNIKKFGSDSLPVSSGGTILMSHYRHLHVIYTSTMMWTLFHIAWYKVELCPTSLLHYKFDCSSKNISLVSKLHFRLPVFPWLRVSMFPCYCEFGP